MSPGCAATAAKQLAAELIGTVGDFLGLTHEECMEQLPRTVVRKLDRFLEGCPGVFEHAALGTCGGCEMSLHCRLTLNMRLLIGFDHWCRRSCASVDQPT